MKNANLFRGSGPRHPQTRRTRGAVELRRAEPPAARRLAAAQGRPVQDLRGPGF